MMTSIFSVKWEAELQSRGHKKGRGRKQPSNLEQIRRPWKELTKEETPDEAGNCEFRVGPHDFLQ